MRRRWLLAVVCGTTVAGLFVMVASQGEVRLAERAPSFDLNNETPSPVATRVPSPGVAGDRQGRTTPNDRVGVPDVMSGVVQVGVVAAGAVLAITLWRRRPAVRRRSPTRAAGAGAGVEMLRASLIDAAESHRHVLAEGEPRNAIVACWVRLEEVVEGSGVPRQPADTSTEFTARLLAGLSVDGLAVERLAALYREARFSSHALGEDRRSEAIALLDAIHAGLGAGGVRAS